MLRRILPSQTVYVTKKLNKIALKTFFLFILALCYHTQVTQRISVEKLTISRHKRTFH